ncbi:outer membrane beta-barrel protein [Granulicella cerasi]|uniref:Outer membrane beta-barrel protein n=1 Tax=Granulicella cerasi TaxID=741063 RepID=A0ABW1Z7U8_9BACT|nr:outer membrane beta-barrel protein [Granulicella cerasi]
MLPTFRLLARRFAGVATLLVCGMVAASIHAQAAKSATDNKDSRVDIYGGYAFWHPLNSGIDGKQYQDMWNPNATASVSYYFNRYVGVQMEGSYFSGQNEHKPYDPNCTKTMCDQLIYTAEAGPVLRYPIGHWVPFIHALGGGERTNGPVDQHLFWGWGVTGGAGLDYVFPFWNQRLAVRPIQADWQYSQVVYGPLVLPAGNVGGFGEISALKLSGGIVLRFGEIHNPQPISIGCKVEPGSVLAGEPITATAETMGLNPKRKAVFTWNTNGGHLTPNGPTASVDTTGLLPGEYVVGARLTQGPHAYEIATCEAPFTVKKLVEPTAVAAAPDASGPPTISCSALPTSAPSGTTIDITATAGSPGNRPLSYSYAASAGQITGNGSTARLTTAGIGDGLITVTCNVVDDQGQRASSTAAVQIAMPIVPVIPQTRQLCSISFERDRRRPARVDNEAKACLDDIALTLGSQTDAHLEMVGNARPNENPQEAAERALNARQYLVQEKGIDPSRIEVRVGQTSGRTLDNVLVPTGSTYNDGNTQLFDEGQIHRHGEAYGVHHGAVRSGVSRPGATRVHRRTAVRRSTASRAVAPAAAPTTNNSGSPVIPPLQ